LHAAKPVAPVAAARPQPVVVDSAPVGRIELQLRGENNSTANVLFADRGGQVQVTVRAPDPSVVHALRAELQQLSTCLENHGYQLRMPTPASALASVSAARDAEASSGDPSTNMHDERPNDPQQGQRNPRHRNGRDPRWYEELE